MTKRPLLLTLLVFLSLSFTPIEARALVIGVAEPNTGNCGPFGCRSWRWDPYQQIYGAAAFSGPIRIESLTFYHTQFDSGTSDVNRGTYDIQFSTTSAQVDALSRFHTENLGPDNQSVFLGPLVGPAPFGGSFTIHLDSPYEYNPTLGNLLMTITAYGVGPSNIFLDYTQSETDQMSRAWKATCPAGCDRFTNSGGLVTGFNETLRVSVPPTSSLLLLAVLLLGRSKANRFFRTHRQNA